MEIKRYKTGAQLITSKGYVPGEDIFDYSISPLAELFNRFYKFAQDNLDYHCGEYKIQPATFFFKNDTTINAAAGRINGHSIIFINSGALGSMYNLLHQHNHAFSSDDYLVTCFAKLLPLDTPPGYLMYQVTIQFTYYHELAHLIQKSPTLQTFITETYAANQSSYKPEKHLTEFDADLYAAQLTYFHLYEFWKKLDAPKQTSESLGRIISLTISGLLFYFALLGGTKMPLYFDDCDHPHPLIRITYIVDIIIEVAAQNLTDLTLDADIILREALNISQRICTAAGHENITKGYVESLYASYKQIEAYVNKLISDSNNISYLVKNRIKR